jgi:NAD(P)H-flavin reductase
MEYHHKTATKEQLIRGSMQPRRFRIDKVYWETNETFTHELIPIDGGMKFQFRPGQFNMIYIFGVGEIPISICGDPDNPNRLYHTTRVVGDVTKRKQHLKVGDLLGIRGPFGNGWPVEKAKGRDVVVIAGGIGLAPIRPIIYHLLNHRDDYESITLIYGTRSPDKILYRKELEKWSSRLDMDVSVTVDSAGRTWKGPVGIVTKLIPRIMSDPDNSTAFVCGPEIMMRFTAMELVKRDFAEENIYISMERNHKCGIGFCGHCQLGSYFLCKDGPVFSYDKLKSYLSFKEV